MPRFGLGLVDKLDSALVNFRVNFWYDGSIYNCFKINPSLIRLVIQSFEKETISMPDEVREIIFPDRVPVRMLDPPLEELEKMIPQSQEFMKKLPAKPRVIWQMKNYS